MRVIVKQYVNLAAWCVIGVALVGCAGPDVKEQDKLAARQWEGDPTLTLFSAYPAGSLPEQWAPLTVLPRKKTTEYALIKDGDSTVLHAHAKQALSGLRHTIDIDPLRYAWLNWRWKIGGLIKGADNSRRETEDAPVRIVLAFDGDKSRLSFWDAIFFDAAKLISGHEVPYATLMYIWENKASPETIIPNTRTGRIQMLVAESSDDKIGQWVHYERNIVEDYEKAFGEKPGRLIAVGVLTDTDNTAETVEAWYGDIRLLHRPQITPTLN